MNTANPDLELLLDELGASVTTTLDTAVEVEESDGSFDAEDIRSSSSKKWVKLPEVVAVAFDMVGSTKLSLKHHDKSTAKIYQSGVGGAVRSLNAYGANFIDIQGDGGFGLFWGEKAYERALCSAITIKTFSLTFTEKLGKKYGDGLPETGFKVGIHAARTLVKKIGTLRKPEEQEPVWAGKPVNYAYKCAQAADAHLLVITDRIWQKFKNNDFVVYSCGCSEGATPSNDMWEPMEHEILPEDENTVHVLQSAWCPNCGPKYAKSIMNGETARTDITNYLREQQRMKMETALVATARRDRTQRVARLRGLSKR